MNAVRTWRERIGQNADFPLHAPTDVERAMEAEIAELRALIAANASGATPPGTIRPGVGEARPPRERRRYLDSGME